MENHIHKRLLSIPEPCPEKWEGMQDAPEGKYCDSCEKGIHDFSLLNRDEIFVLQESTQGHICGRINISQLDVNPIQTWILKQLYWAKLKTFIIALTFVFGSQLFNLSPIYSKNLPETGIAMSEATIYGRIIDDNGEGIPFVNIAIYQNDILIAGDMTDFDGFFNIQLNEGMYDLKASYLGNFTEVKGLKIMNGMEMVIDDITMEMSTMGFVGDIYISTIPIVNPHEMETGTTIKREQIQNSPRN